MPNKISLFLLLSSSIVLICIRSVLDSNEKIIALKRLWNKSDDEVNAFMKSFNHLNQKDVDNWTKLLTLDDFKKNVKFNKKVILSDTNNQGMYDTLNDLCTLANVIKMYLPPIMDKKKSVQKNQELYEKKVIKLLNVKENSVLLELGCGAGRISHNVSLTLNSDVHGFTNSKECIKKAKDYAKKKNNKRTHFTFASFNDKFKFNDNLFDGVYEFGALGYSHDMVKTFKEVYRVLKPGGRFVISDAVIMDNFDRNNDHHIKLLYSTVAVGEWIIAAHYKYWEKWGKEAGFKVVLSRHGGEIGPMIDKILKIYRRLKYFIYSSTYLKIIPAHIKKILDRASGEALRDWKEAEENKLLTVNWEIVFVKPLN